jgi:valyl-tRNA synthetase
MNLSKDNYDPKEAEPRIQKFWEKEGIFKFDMNSKAKVFSIDTPPPTVSGSLHIGHAFNFTQFDSVVRYKRMSGFNIFFPFGTDDNGLATERLIEKMKNVKSRHMKRKDFIKLCLDTLAGLREEYTKDVKRIGISCDFDIFYSTIDEHCRRISQRSFIQLYKQGREYQKEAPTIWCPECQTAIAQAELKDKASDTTFNDIIFKAGKENLIIATTRPELLSSCVAVFYNPSDPRYRKLKGKKARVPIFNFEVPILEDEKADPSKGTGIVMCCTFGDQTDVEWWKAHNLPLKVSIDKEGRLNENAGKYQGLNAKEARKKIIDDLKKQGLLVKQEKISHVLNVHERCDTPVEFLVTKQWFIKYLDLKDKFLELGEKLKWHPEFMKVRYENWIKGLKWDWCISRQRYFGVPFPVWYCEKCHEVILASENQLPADPLTDKPPVKECGKCGCKDFVPEEDVLDTWATSSLTPRLAVELMPEKIQDKLYPMSLHPQAQDIITFWLFNTIVKSWLHYKTLPWEHAMISGYVLDPLGEKMSKSKGNIVKPQEIIDKYSADSVRYWVCSSTLGEDVTTQEKEMIAGQKTLTKLWNAAKFSMPNASSNKPKKFEKIDLWMLSKLNRLIESCTESFESYDSSKARQEVNNFFWHTFCDNYLEIIKDRIYNSKKGRDSAQYVLHEGFLAILKMYAPIMPYITEELYQIYFRKSEKSKSIHVSEWPESDKKMIDEDIEKIGDRFVEILKDVRMAKSKAQKSMKAGIILTIEKKDFDLLKDVLDDLKSVAAAKEIKTGKFDIKFA